MSCDNSRTYDALYQLYIKQSLSFETICDLLELKKLDVVKALEKEMADDELNETLKSVYSEAVQSFKGNELVEKIAEQLELEFTKPKDIEPHGFGDKADPILVKCPACDGVGWTVLFVVRRDCTLCAGDGEVDADKWFEYKEEDKDKR